MKQLVAKFRKSQSGATAIEYGLIALGIAIAIIVVVAAIGSGLEAIFGTVNSGLA